MLSLNKRWIISAGVFVFIVVAALLTAGCQGGPADGKSAMVSASGIKAESLIPADVFMVVKAGSADKEQLKRFNELMEVFPANPVAALVDEMAADFDEANSETGIDFKKDVLPAVGESWQLMFAMGGDMVKDKEPLLMMVFMPADAEKIEDLMKKLPASGKGSEIKSGDRVIYSNESEDFFFVRNGDVILMGNRIEKITEMLDGKGQNLFANVSYVKGAEKAGNGLAFFFIDPSVVMRAAQAEIRESEEYDKMKRIMDVSMTVKGEFFGITAEKDGLILDGFVYMDMGKWRELGLPDVTNMPPSYMFKELPGDGALFYMESSSLKESVEILLDIYGEVDEFAQGIGMLKAALAMQRLDLEKDLLSFMDRGFVVSMNEKGGLMPGMGIYFDAKSNPEGAKKLNERIYEGFESMLKEGQLDEDALALFSHGKQECGEGECYLFEMDFSKVPEEKTTNVLVELSKEKTGFSYGLTENGLAYYTLYPDFTAGGYDTMEDNERFMEAMSHINGYDLQVTFLDMEKLLNYLNKWVSAGLEAEGKDMSDMPEDYQMAMEYLKPFKYMSAGSKDIVGDEAQMRIFIKISK